MKIEKLVETQRFSMLQKNVSKYVGDAFDCNDPNREHTIIEKSSYPDVAITTRCRVGDSLIIDHHTLTDTTRIMFSKEDLKQMLKLLS